MKGLSRLLRTGEDAVQGAAAASHDGRECVGVGWEATQPPSGQALAVGPWLRVAQPRATWPGGSPAGPIRAAGVVGSTRTPFLPRLKNKMSDGGKSGGG